MMVTLNFNANEVVPSGNFEPIPEGWYLAVITDSEMKETRDGMGKYLKMYFEIIEGEYKGRRVWSNLNLVHSNPIAVELAKADLSAICRAVDVIAPTDSGELHNLPLLIKVKCRTNKVGAIVNDVRGYKARGAVPRAMEGGAAPLTPCQGIHPLTDDHSPIAWKRG
jgi:hypothetical protein